MKSDLRKCSYLFTWDILIFTEFLTSIIMECKSDCSKEIRFTAVIWTHKDIHPISKFKDMLLG